MLLCLGLPLLPGCYQQDPLVSAAQNLQRSAYEFAKQEEDRKQQFNLLELGMSQSEVRKRLGPPSARQSRGESPEESHEVWTYNRSMQDVVLTFTNQKLTEIRME
jgi:hypothetical protein